MPISFYPIFKQPRFLKERYPFSCLLSFASARLSLTPIVIDLCYLMRTENENLMRRKRKTAKLLIFMVA
mgnify:CR=1 FL=1